jgi:hypothetical protein
MMSVAGAEIADIANPARKWEPAAALGRRRPLAGSMLETFGASFTGAPGAEWSVA